MDYTNISECEHLTKMNQESQNQRLRFFAKVDTSSKLKILQLQKNIFHKFKSTNSNVDNSVLTLSSLIIAIDGFRKELDNVNLNVIKIRGKNCKTKVKRQKLLGYWAIVKTLRMKEKMSFRDISKYFGKYHKLEVSYSTIYELWTELENNKEA